MTDVDLNRWDVRLSKALNLISYDEKRQLWHKWGKKKYGAIYVIKSDEDLEKVIEIGGIPNSPKKAVYISVARSLAIDLDPGKYLIKVWSEKLPHIKNSMQPLSGGVSYPFINVEFFDDNSGQCRKMDKHTQGEAAEKASEAMRELRRAFVGMSIPRDML